MPTMDRKGFWLKPGVRATAPGVLFCVCTSPNVTTATGDESRQWWDWGGADVVMAERRAGAWRPYKQQRCETTAELHEWIESHACKHRRNYVVVPDGQETAAQTRLWEHIDTGHVRYQPAHVVRAKRDSGRKVNYGTVIRRVALSHRCFILDYERTGRRVLWVGGRQYFDAPEDALQPIAGVGWVDSGDWYGAGGSGIRTPRERAVMWLHLFQRLSDWWVANAKAPFGLTGSALSMGMLRTHVSKQAISTHTDADVHQVEREACFGGMARTFYYGDLGPRPIAPGKAAAAPARSRYGRIPGPMYHYDVRSMYPTLLRDNVYPRRLYRRFGEITPRELLQACETSGVIARVQVETEVAEYPERHAGHIYYRTGRFTTTLTGPELLRLSREGKIVRVHCGATYYMGTPFKSAAKALIDMRQTARDAKQPAWELFAKLIGNGLGGKLAQKSGEWIHRPKTPAVQRYGEWVSGSTGKCPPKRYRGIAGLTWEWSPDPTGAGPYTAAFAYLTAYGRLLLRSVREVCPDRSVLSIDTDGLWVTAEGRDAIERSDVPKGDRAGMLKADKESACGRFFGPRHYWCEQGWVLAGMTLTADQGVSQMHTHVKRYTPIGGPAGCAPRGTSVKTVASALAVESRGVSVGKDGWAKPTRRR